MTPHFFGWNIMNLLVLFLFEEQSIPGPDFMEFSQGGVGPVLM